MPNFSALPTSRTRENIRVTTAASPSFLSGALLVSTAGVYAECGANPATIDAIAAEPGGKNPEGNTLCLVHRVTEGNRFWMAFTSDGTTPTAPAITDMDITYGVTKGTDGIWTVDKSKNAANQRVGIHSIDLDRNLVEVSVLAANRGTPP